MPRRLAEGGEGEGGEGEGGEGEGQPAASPPGGAGFEEELDFLEDEGEGSPASRARAERERLRAQASARRASLSELIPGFDQLLQAQQQQPTGPRPGAEPRGKRAKKPKSDAEVAASVGRVVQRLVKGLEAEVAGNLELYAASQIFPDRALKSAKRAFDELVFDRAWKKIEVNLLVAEAEARNGDTAEEERWAEQVLGAGNWQASLRTTLTEGTGRRTLAPEREALDALRSVPMPRRVAELEGLLAGEGPVDVIFDVGSEFDFVHEKAKAATAGGRPQPAGAGRGRAGGPALEPKFAHHAKQTLGARAW